MKTIFAVLFILMNSACWAATQVIPLSPAELFTTHETVENPDKTLKTVEMVWALVRVRVVEDGVGADNGKKKETYFTFVAKPEEIKTKAKALAAAKKAWEKMKGSVKTINF